MASGLRIQRTSSGGVTKVELVGRITEDADFSDAQVPPGRTVIDLSGIKSINSCGVREWVRFVEKLPANAETYYDKVPPAMAAQANMIANFLGRGAVVTVLAPYFCAQCSDSVEVLLDVRKDFAQGLRAPARPCPTCKSPLAFDDVEGFFDFLKPKKA